MVQSVSKALTVKSVSSVQMVRSVSKALTVKSVSKV
jgi:hypothetical protein